MKAVLKVNTLIAQDTLYLEYDLGEDVAFLAGQFFSLTLLDPPFTDNRGNRRHFGFVNSPSQAKIAALVTRTGPSAFKRSLQAASVGQVAEVDQVKGEMVLPDDTSGPLVIIAGGIGIAPYMSMLRQVREKSLPYKITLIYSNAYQAGAVFLNELQELAKENPNINFVPTMTRDIRWPGEKQRIDSQFLTGHVQLDPGNLYFISGTPRFVPAMVKILRDLGVNSNRLKFEIFTGY